MSGDSTTETPKTRKDMLRVAAVAAGAAAAGSLASASSAKAADGDPLVLGQSNTASSQTKLTSSTTVASDGALSVTAAAADYGIYGSGKSYGIAGSGPGGVLGLGTVGGVFSGSVVAVNLDPQDNPGAPTGQAFKGDMAVDSDGVLWLCIGSGTPGNWIKVSHGGTRYLSSPQRAYDSRNDAAGKLQGGFPIHPRTVDIRAAIPSIPAAAVGIVGNFTVTQEDGGGFATIWPSGAWPGTSNINFNPGVDLANAFSVGLSSSGTVEIAASAATHAIVDVAGYIL